MSSGVTVISNHNKNDSTKLDISDISQKVSESAGLGHVLWDEISENCLEYSCVILKIHNLSSDEFMRRISEEDGMLHVSDEDRDRVRKDRNNCKLHAQPYDIRYRIYCDDGHLKWIHEIGQPYTIEDGRVLSSVRSMQDITKDVLERELLEREKFFIQQVERTAGIGVFVWDIATQRNLYCSDNLAYLHGMLPSELEITIDGEDGDIDLADPADRAHVAAAYERSRLYGEPIDVEYRFHHPEKGLRWFHEVASRRVMGEDKREVTMGLLHDITDKKRIEEQVFEQKFLASEANRVSKAKSQFLTNMSHELRTPLNAVLGFAQLLLLDLNKSLSFQEKGYISNIIDGGNHLLNLINQVLDLAKIEADKIQLSMEVVPVNPVIADCINLIEPLSAPKGIKLINNFSNKNVVHVNADVLRFKQVFLNLLSNAVKYNMVNGSVTVHGDVVDNKYLRLRISDTGLGIDEQDQHRVFEMFNRLGQNPQIAQEGSGIGLSVCRLLVDKMGGRIGCESEKNVGSTFWFELPLASLS